MKMVFTKKNILVVSMLFMSSCSNNKIVNSVVPNTTNNAGNSSNGSSNTVLPLIALADQEIIIGNSTVTITPSGGTPPYILSIISGGGTVNDLEYTAPPLNVSNIILNVADNSGQSVQLTLLSLGGMQVWFDASSIIANDGDPVSTWVDKSDNSNNAVQATIARQPIYRSSGAFLPNERPVLRFSFASEWLQTVNSIPALNDLIMFVVFRDDTISAWEKILSTDYGTGFEISRDYNYVGRWGGHWVNIEGAYSSSFPETEWSIITSRRVVADSTHYLYRNGGFLTSRINGSLNAITTANPLSIGRPYNADNRYFDDGYIAEILIYPFDLSQVERELVECYLGDKYNFTIGHSCSQ